jgi:hypothetical protein
MEGIARVGGFGRRVLSGPLAGNLCDASNVVLGKWLDCSLYIQWRSLAWQVRLTASRLVTPSCWPVVKAASSVA